MNEVNKETNRQRRGEREQGVGEDRQTKKQKEKQNKKKRYIKTCLSSLL